MLMPPVLLRMLTVIALLLGCSSCLGEEKHETVVLPKDFTGWVIIFYTGTTESPRELRLEVPASGIVEVAHKPVFEKLAAQYVNPDGTPFSPSVQGKQPGDRKIQGAATGAANGVGYRAEYRFFHVGTRAQFEKAEDHSDFTDRMVDARYEK